MLPWDSQTSLGEITILPKVPGCILIVKEKGNQKREASGVVCLFLQSLLALHIRGLVTDFTGKLPRFGTNKRLYTCSLYYSYSCTCDVSLKNISK